MTRGKRDGRTSKRAIRVEVRQWVVGSHRAVIMAGGAAWRVLWIRRRRLACLGPLATGTASDFGL